MKHLFFIFFFLGFFQLGFAQDFDLELAWSTYFGDEQVRFHDSALDRQGNIYFVGKVFDTSGFSATPDSHQPEFGGGVLDGFIAKMNPSGELIWATYYGGEDDDYISAISIDESDNIFIIGRTNSQSNIATPGSFEPELLNSGTNIFLARFTTDGERLWATYYPGNLNIFSNMTVEISDWSIVASQGFIYFVFRTNVPNQATSGAYQTDIGDYGLNTLISKFSITGDKIWATYYGINRSAIFGVGVGENSLYVYGETMDCPPNNTPNTYFATENAHQSEPGNCTDLFFSKFSLDGELEWSTYYGGIHPEKCRPNSVTVIGDDVYFVALAFGTTGNITTPGSYQESVEHSDGLVPFLVKFNSSGEREWATFIGSNSTGSVAGYGTFVNKDAFDNLYVTAHMRLSENIATPDAYQYEIDDNNSTFLCVFDTDGDLKYGTYFGASGDEYAFRPLILDNQIYLFGQTNSVDGITTENSYQPDYVANDDSNFHLNMFIAKLWPQSMDVPTNETLGLMLYPNPVKDKMTLEGKTAFSKQTQLTVYDLLGRKITSYPSQNTTTQEIEVSNLSDGVYFLGIKQDGQESFLRFVKE